MTTYSGKFQGRNFCELVENTSFAEKTFANCSLLPHQRMLRPQILRKKTFANSHAQNCKICKSFIPRKFPAIQCCLAMLPDYMHSWHKICHCNSLTHSTSLFCKVLCGFAISACPFRTSQQAYSGSA